MALAFVERNGVSLNNLEDFISRKREEWDVCRVASHEIAVQYSQNTFMGNDKEIVLFTLEFEDNRLKTDSYIVI
jgi:hypothetical protein